MYFRVENQLKYAKAQVDRLKNNVTSHDIFDKITTYFIF